MSMAHGLSSTVSSLTVDEAGPEFSDQHVGPAAARLRRRASLFSRRHQSVADLLAGRIEHGIRAVLERRPDGDGLQPEPDRPAGRRAQSARNAHLAAPPGRVRARPPRGPPSAASARPARCCVWWNRMPFSRSVASHRAAGRRWSKSAAEARHARDCDHRERRYHRCPHCESPVRTLGGVESKSTVEPIFHVQSGDLLKATQIRG